MNDTDRHHDARLALDAGSEHEAAWTEGGFVLDTTVDVGDGYRCETEFLSAGCMVAARCERSGRIEQRLVLRSFEYMRRLCRVEFDVPSRGCKSGLVAAPGQLVWVEPAGWTRMADLRPGDLLCSDDGLLMPVVAVSTYLNPESAFGIVVDGLHAYSAGWLRVHDGYRAEQERTWTEPGSGAMFVRHAGPHPEHAALTLADARCMLENAKNFWPDGQSWMAGGAGATVFDGISVEVARLDGNVLATIEGNTITLSDSAAGWGWYICFRMLRRYGVSDIGPEPKAEPFDQSYYSTVPYYGGDPAGTKIDLLIVLMLQLREVVTRRPA